MSRKWLALLLSGLMCAAPLMGVAEGAAAFDANRVAPLLDAVTTAALGSDDEVTSLTEEEALTASFARRIMTALAMSGLQSDEAALDAVTAMPLPDLSMPALTDAYLTPHTLRIMSADVSEDGGAAMLIGEVMVEGEPAGRRAVIELRRSDASPVGWEICRFTVGDAALEEAMSEEFFAQTMVEYMNAAYGYSIQYPAIFTEDMIVATPSGVQAELADGSASFSVTRVENDGKLTMDEVLAQETINNPGAQVSVDEITGAGRSVLTDEEGVTHVAVFLVSEGSIYQAELNYPQAREADFAQMADYMMNSFSADELGLG